MGNYTILKNGGLIPHPWVNMQCLKSLEWAFKFIIYCYVPGITRNKFRKPKFSYLESQQKALLKFNKIY